MKRHHINRLVLPGLMAAMLMLSLAYWWLENIPHEIFGTTLFALLAWHMWVNRLWFKNLARGRYDVRRTFTVALHAILALNMVVLLLTSLAISRSIFSALPISDSVFLRQVHWFSAYWVMIAVGVHIGLHWSRVMTLIRSAAGLTHGSSIRTLILRAAAVAAAAFGLWSFVVLDVWTKLTFTYSIDVWNFKTSVAPFFGHWLGVTMVPAIVSHYVTVYWRGAR
jgi:hypothetical protein